VSDINPLWILGAKIPHRGQHSNFKGYLRIVQTSKVMFVCEIWLPYQWLYQMVTQPKLFLRHGHPEPYGSMPFLIGLNDCFWIMAISSLYSITIYRWQQTTKKGYRLDRSHSKTNIHAHDESLHNVNCTKWSKNPGPALVKFVYSVYSQNIVSSNGVHDWINIC